MNRPQSLQTNQCIKKNSTKLALIFGENCFAPFFDKCYISKLDSSSFFWLPIHIYHNFIRQNISGKQDYKYMIQQNLNVFFFNLDCTFYDNVKWIFLIFFCYGLWCYCCCFWYFFIYKVQKKLHIKLFLSKFSSK